MEDEIDIYADLPNFDAGDNENLAEKNKKLTEKCSELEKKVAELTKTLESLKKINSNLEVNFSSLLLTAKAEVARKDRMIAEIRRQLDDMQFRRGDHAKPSSETARRSPSRRRRKRSPEEQIRVQEPEVPDRTEFVCGDPMPLIGNEEGNAVNGPRLDGIVSTVFGERLRKRILEEQEEERKQQEQSRAARKIIESDASKKTLETDTQSGSKVEDSLKLDSKVKLRIKGENCDRKRPTEDNKDSAPSRKRFKTSEGESRYRDRSRSGLKHLESKSKDRNSAEMDMDARFRVVDEYSAPEGGEDDTEDRHNRVAIRLMLLAEGIDPDAEKVKPTENGEKKIVGDKRENGKRREARSRSRSKSRNRRHNYKSRSRTPDQNHRSRRRSRQRDERPRRSRDRFERRRDSKNKDGDNLSDFSREIYDLREKLEHRVDDGSGNRAEKGRGPNRVRRNEERIGKSGKSRTPDSSRSGSKERVQRSKADKQLVRSRSRERHGSRNRGRRYSKDEDVPVKHSKTEIPRAEKTEVVEILPSVVAAQKPANPETQSLVSLEEGEIMDSVESSPGKVVVNPVLSSIEKAGSPRFNLIDSAEPVSKSIDIRSSLPSREIENSQSNEKPQPVEEPVLPIQPIQLESGSDFLNTSKDERIENIAEFIANFPANPLELEKDQQSSRNIIKNELSHEMQLDTVHLEEYGHGEKIQSTSSTRSQAAMDEVPIELPPTENSHVLNTHPLTCTNVDNDWCLIAIDSPIKNFEENRKNRMIAQSVLNKKKPNVPEAPTTDDEPYDTITQSMQEEKEPEAPKAATTDDRPLLEPLSNTIAHSVQKKEKPEVPEAASTCDVPVPKQSNDTDAQSVQKEKEPEVSESAKMDDEPLLEQLNDGTGTPCGDEKYRAKDCGVDKKKVSDKRKKPVIRSIKIISKAKPTALTTLTSTYHRCRKELVLSDINSEQCVKIPMTSPTINRLSVEPETVPQGEEETKKPGRSVMVEKSSGARTNRKKPSADKLFGDENDSKNVADDKGTVLEMKPEIVTSKKTASEKNKNSGKSRAKNSKTNIPKPELRNTTNSTKDSKITSKKVTATKTGASKSIKKEETKSIGSTKNKTGSKVDKIGSKAELDSNKPAKAVPKGSNSKQKKQPKKLIVNRGGRKAVNSRDTSTSITGVGTDSLSDKVDDSENTAANDLELSNSSEDNSESVMNQNEFQAQTIVARNRNRKLSSS